jgi:hypothetical protein
MTSAVQQLIASFEQLTKPEKNEAVAEILRRSAPFSSPPIEDDEFLFVQEETFLELDAREAADEDAAAR